MQFNNHEIPRIYHVINLLQLHDQQCAWLLLSVS